jgi:hypothetical protein
MDRPRTRCCARVGMNVKHWPGRRISSSFAVRGSLCPEVRDIDRTDYEPRLAVRLAAIGRTTFQTSSRLRTIRRFDSPSSNLTGTEAICVQEIQQEFAGLHGHDALHDDTRPPTLREHLYGDTSRERVAQQRQVKAVATAKPWRVRRTIREAYAPRPLEIDVERRCPSQSRYHNAKQLSLSICGREIDDKRATNARHRSNLSR